MRSANASFFASSLLQPLYQSLPFGGFRKKDQGLQKRHLPRMFFNHISLFGSICAGL